MNDSVSNDGSSERAPTLTGELLALYLGGDDESERRLFDTQREALLSRARRLAGVRALQAHVGAEDLVAEVFLRVLHSGRLADFVDREAGSLRRHLFGKLDDVIHDTYRRLGATKRGGGRPVSSLEDSPSAVSPPSMESTPTEHARASELTDLLREILSPDEWRVWNLVEHLGLTSDEAARELGTTDAAVRGILFRVRKKAVRALAERRDGGAGGERRA